MKTNTALYRHFSLNGTLLYVGISLSATTRLAQHASTAPWYEEIATVNIEYFDTKEKAVIAEKEAIEKEFPLFNKQHIKNKYRIPTTIPFDKLDEIMKEGEVNYYFAFKTAEEFQAFSDAYKNHQRKKLHKERVKRYLNNKKQKSLQIQP